MSTKRGRKAGSGSFMSVTLAELNAALKPGARVIVWGRYAQMLGLDGKKIDAKPDALIAAVAGGKSDVELETFEKDTKSETSPSNKDTKSETSPSNKDRHEDKEDIVPKVSVELQSFDDDIF
jgi:hypothetical protein